MTQHEALQMARDTHTEAFETSTTHRGVLGKEEHPQRGLANQECPWRDFGDQKGPQGTLGDEKRPQGSLGGEFAQSSDSRRGPR